MRTTTYQKRTLVAFDVDESSGELVVNVLVVFHRGQDWAAVLGTWAAGRTPPGKVGSGPKSPLGSSARR